MEVLFIIFAQHNQHSVCDKLAGGRKMNIVVTGATSGVGMAIVRKLCAQGHTVFATGRSEAGLHALKAIGATAIKADLTQPHDQEALMIQLPDVDCVILCAGVGDFSDFSSQTDDSIQQMIAVNVTATALLARRFTTKMLAQGYGQLIFIGSQAGKVATPKAVVYAATKHAIVGLANGLRLELAPHHIVVTAIHPGPIDTPFLHKADSTNRYKKAVANVLLSPEKVADETIKVIGTSKREVNLPRIMGLTSKMYQLAPVFIETIGKSFFYKK